MQIDIERRLAIAALLAQPDPPELHRRGYRVRIEGKPERFDLVPRLASAFVQAKLLALHERRDEVGPAIQLARLRANTPVCKASLAAA